MMSSKYPENTAVQFPFQEATVNALAKKRGINVAALRQIGLIRTLGGNHTSNTSSTETCLLSVVHGQKKKASIHSIGWNSSPL